MVEKRLLGGLRTVNKSIVPNFFTSSNLAFGVLGITFSTQGLFSYAAICVLLSLVADAFDGRTARALGVAGPFGRELDSLADVVSFGVSPAYMMFMYAFQGIGWLGYVPLLVFSVLGAFRLARFNIMTTEIKGFFQGLAIPTAGCLCATYVLSGIKLPTIALLITMLVVAYLMVSEVPYPDFKGHPALVIQPLAKWGVLLLGVVLLAWDWHVWPVLPFALYTLFGLINLAINTLKGK